MKKCVQNKLFWGRFFACLGRFVAYNRFFFIKKALILLQQSPLSLSYRIVSRVYNNMEQLFYSLWNNCFTYR